MDDTSVKPCCGKTEAIEQSHTLFHEYAIFTVVRHFSGKGKIERIATQILDTIEERDNLLVISVVSLMEIMYLAEKHRIDINLGEVCEL